jgi:hypothetical protein
MVRSSARPEEVNVHPRQRSCAETALELRSFRRPEGKHSPAGRENAFAVAAMPLARRAPISPGPTVKRVPVRSSVERVPSRAAVEPVAGVFPEKEVIAASTDDEIGAPAAINRVAAQAAGEAIGEP